jgi:alkylmercury lyase
VSADPRIGLDELDAALARAAPDLTGDGRGLAVAVYRLLASGEPVTVEAAATAAAMTAADVERTLQSWPAVYRDEQGRVIGLWGLALSEMHHRLRVDGADVFAWCAWDPLFLALVVGAMDVATDDPVTGETIAYRISADGTIGGLTHPDAVLSFLRPDQPWADDVMATFCDFVLQFTGADSARQWISAHPGTFAVGLADAAELARRHAVHTFGSHVRPGVEPAGGRPWSVPR